MSKVDMVCKILESYMLYNIDISIYNNKYHSAWPSMDEHRIVLCGDDIQKLIILTIPELLNNVSIELQNNIKSILLGQ